MDGFVQEVIERVRLLGRGNIKPDRNRIERGSEIGEWSLAVDVDESEGVVRCETWWGI
jgi:hypothetical protein